MREVAEGARELLAPRDGEASKDVADRASRICRQLTQHLARLVGEIGVAALVRRSIVLATIEFPWLAIRLGDPLDVYIELHAVLERQPPATAAAGFIGVFTTFVGLLKRLIGDGLVDHLLAELWPAIFPIAVQETP